MAEDKGPERVPQIEEALRRIAECNVGSESNAPASDALQSGSSVRLELWWSIRHCRLTMQWKRWAGVRHGGR